MILSFDEAGALLDEMAEEFPPEFYDELNGGIALLPEAKEDPEGEHGELYIMGEYCNDMMGKYINLYYGSFAALAGQEDWTEEDWEDELYTTLAHEFTHHIEGRAGERGLERRARGIAARRQTKQGPADAFASAGPFPIFRSPVLGHHREELQRLCPVVDQGVGVPLRAVVTVSRSQTLLAAAVQGLARAGENVHNFAALLVGVQADGAPRLQPPPHDAVAPVRKHPGVGHSLAALEPEDGSLLYDSEFHLHSNSSSDYSSDTPNRPAISRRPSSSSSRPKPAASSWASVRSLSRA